MTSKIEELILELVNEAQKENLPKWLHNKDNSKQILYSGPFFDKNELEAGIKAFLTGNWLVSGGNVAKFQKEFSKLFEVSESHMVNSGSSANLVLIAALKKYFNWEDTSEIIVSPVGFPTTIAPIVQNKMVPIFADIEFDTLNFDLKQVESKITKNTKAIFVSPVLGNPPNMDFLQKLAEKYGIVLIGDNCDSLGSKWNGKYLHEYYIAWSCSFYPAHHITTGEGGMICSNIPKIIDYARQFSWWGRDCYCVGTNNLLSCGSCGNRFDKWLDGYDGIVDHKYVFSEMGYNLKPLDMQGAIGSVQLTKFNEIDTKRKENKKKWEELISKYIPNVRIASNFSNSDPSWFGVPLICESKQQKEKLQNNFEEKGIQTRNYFAGNILMHKGYKHLDDYKKYPNANLVLERVFFVGCPPHYTEQTFERIEKILKNINNATHLPVIKE